MAYGAVTSHHLKGYQHAMASVSGSLAAILLSVELHPYGSCRVQALTEPININLNVRIQHEIIKIASWTTCLVNPAACSRG
jgi:hypothetical protein